MHPFGYHYFIVDDCVILIKTFSDGKTGEVADLHGEQELEGYDLKRTLKDEKASTSRTTLYD